MYMKNFNLFQTANILNYIGRYFTSKAYKPILILLVCKVNYSLSAVCGKVRNFSQNSKKFPTKSQKFVKFCGLQNLTML